MRKVYVVQVTFTGRCDEMNVEAQERFGGNNYRTNGMQEVFRTKRAADSNAESWRALGDVATSVRLQAESLDEAFFALIGGRAA